MSFMCTLDLDGSRLDPAGRISHPVVVGTGRAHAIALSSRLLNLQTRATSYTHACYLVRVFGRYAIPPPNVFVV